MQKLPKKPEKPGQSPQNNRAQHEKISCRTKENPRKEDDVQFIPSSEFALLLGGWQEVC